SPIRPCRHRPRVSSPVAQAKSRLACGRIRSFKTTPAPRRSAFIRSSRSRASGPPGSKALAWVPLSHELTSRTPAEPSFSICGRSFVAALLAKSDLDFAQKNLVDYQKAVDLNRLMLQQGTISRGSF